MVPNYAGQNYAYQGFSNGVRSLTESPPTTTAAPRRPLSGDSGGPSSDGQHDPGRAFQLGYYALQNDANAEFAYSNNAGYTWQDVSVFDSIGWINEQMELLCIPEPSTFVLLVFGSVLLLVFRRRRK